MLCNLLDIFQITDNYLSYLKDKIDFTEDGFPIFTKEMFLEEKPDMVITYANRKNKIVVNPKKTVLCFYDNDNTLYVRAEKVLNDIEEYKKYMGVIGLDITVTSDMDEEWQRATILLNQLHLAILACNGIKIVANLRIGSNETLNCLNSIPKNVMCGSGFLGCSRQTDATDFSYISKVLSVMPSTLLIYGKHDMAAEEQLNTMGIDYSIYPDLHRICKGVA